MNFGAFLSKSFLAKLGSKYRRTAYIKDIKAVGTDGGVSVNLTTTIRDLNDLSGDVSFISLNGSSQFTLQPGTYEGDASAPAYRSNKHQAFLYNVTTTAYIDGTSEVADNANNVQNRSHIAFSFTITVPTIFEIRHWIEDGVSPNGLGFSVDHASNPHVGEVFTQVKIVKVL